VTKLNGLGRDAILASLPSMSKADLEAIQVVIGSLLRQGGSKAGLPQNDKPALLFGAMATVINLSQGYVPFVSTASGKAFAKNAPLALAFADRFTLARKAELAALLRWLMALMANDLLRQKIPVGPKTMSEALARLPEIFDRAYPGYMEACLTNLLLERVLKKQEKRK